MELTPPFRIGPYQVLHLLGAGGMGKVYAAVKEPLGQRVALKVLSSDAARDPQLVARFVQEARALATLDLPGVVRVYDSDQADGVAFFAMELLDGLSLRDWMDRAAGPAPIQAALALCTQIAAVLVDVHARNIVHRDLKPENVFLCPDERAPAGHRVKLLDFGVAKVRHSIEPSPSGPTDVHTHATTFLGSAPYTAPEQIRNAPGVDGRTDVYALGVLLYELLAGRPPFKSTDKVELITMHFRDDPPPLREVVPTVPPALAAFVSSMLAKAPEDRPTMLRCREMLGRRWEGAQEMCPVPGLAPFSEAQAELFFGRRIEVAALLELIEGTRTGVRRWVQLEGSSGVGKSSLLSAGLLPRLKERPGWQVAVVRPADEPLRNLARSLAAEGSTEELERAFRANADSLRDLASARAASGELLLLVIEQAEELLTLRGSDSARFDELLSRAVSMPDSPLRLLTIVRSDFLHRLEQLPRLASLLNQAVHYHLQPMQEEALDKVVQGMARTAGLQLAEGLARRMVADSRSGGGGLPLLGHALRGLWSLSGGATVTHAHYERLGGVGGALARQAEELLESLGINGRERAKWILLALVQVGRGVPDSRRPRSRAEVIAAAGGDQLAEEVLLTLTGNRTEPQPGLRILSLSDSSDPMDQRVEVVHETLLQKVPALTGWIEHQRAALERSEDLDAAARAWEAAGGPADGLPTGTLLGHYQRPGMKVGVQAERFLRAARKLERRRLWTRSALLGVSVIAAVAVLLFAQERQHAGQLVEAIAKADRIVGEVDWPLSRLPHTLEERRKLFEITREMLESLPESDHQRPRVRLLKIRRLQRLGDLAYHDETLQASEDRLLEALEEISAAPPDKDVIDERALNRSKLGKVAQARGQDDKARKLFQESISLLEGSPAAENDLRTKAVSLAELAQTEAPSSPHRTQALEMLRQTVRTNGSPYNRALLAEWLVDLSSSEADLKEAIQLARGALEEEKNQYHRWVLARALAALAASGGDLLEAERLARDIHEGEPENKRYAIALGEVLQKREQQTDAEERRHLHEDRCRMMSAFVARDPHDQRLVKVARDCQQAIE